MLQSITSTTLLSSAPVVLDLGPQWAAPRLASRQLASPSYFLQDHTLSLLRVASTLLSEICQKTIGDGTCMTPWKALTGSVIKTPSTICAGATLTTSCGIYLWRCALTPWHWLTIVIFMAFLEKHHAQYLSLNHTAFHSQELRTGKFTREHSEVRVWTTERVDRWREVLPPSLPYKQCKCSH